MFKSPGNILNSLIIRMNPLVGFYLNHQSGRLFQAGNRQAKLHQQIGPMVSCTSLAFNISNTWYFFENLLKKAFKIVVGVCMVNVLRDSKQKRLYFI